MLTFADFNLRLSLTRRNTGVAYYPAPGIGMPTLPGVVINTIYSTRTFLASDNAVPNLLVQQ